MNNLHFALRGAFILLAALLLVFASCTFGDGISEEETAIESDEPEANDNSPVTNEKENEEKPDGNEPPEPSNPDDGEEPGDPSGGDDPSEPSDPDKEGEEPEEENEPSEPSDPDKEGEEPEDENDPSEPSDPDKECEEPEDGIDPSDPNCPNDGKDPDTPSSRIPDLLINELRTEYQRSPPRAEFIEFKMLTAGNLGGLRVFIASNTSNPLVYEFLPVEVKKDEYVVLHLRTLEEANKDEYGDDLAESGGDDSSPTARDFWIPGNTKLLRKTDAVYVMDQNDRILDAVMLAEDTIPARSLAFFFAAAEYLFNKGVWKSASGTLPGHEDAVKTSAIRTSLTRSISRDETVPNTNTSADWYITVVGGVTIGRENDSRRE